MSILLILLLIVIPAIEIYLFILVGSWIGAGWTVALVFLTAGLGLYALRREGLSTLRQAQRAMQAGTPPVLELAHGVLIMIGGVFLLTPGFFTDALGFILMTGLGRIFVMEAVLATFIPTLFGGFDLASRPQGQQAKHDPSSPSRPPRTIDADYRIDD